LAKLKTSFDPENNLATPLTTLIENSRDEEGEINEQAVDDLRETIKEQAVIGPYSPTSTGDYQLKPDEPLELYEGRTLIAQYHPVYGLVGSYERMEFDYFEKNFDEPNFVYNPSRKITECNYSLDFTLENP
jgi:hypothetical protein